MKRLLIIALMLSSSVSMFGAHNKHQADDYEGAHQLHAETKSKAQMKAQAGLERQMSDHKAAQDAAHHGKHGRG